MNNKNEMHFIAEVQQEYEKIDSQWLNLHYRSIIGIVGIGLIIEFLLAFTYYKMTHESISLSFEQYILKYILIPMLLNIGWLCVSIAGMHIGGINIRLRIYLLSISLLGVCFVFYSVHYIFHISIIFFAPILFTAFYDKYLLTTVISILSLLAKLFSDFFVFWDKDRLHPLDSGYTIMTIIVSTLLLIFFYGISMVIIYFQKKKNNAVIKLENERIKMSEQLVIDPLTGIYNRLGMRRMLEFVENSSEDTYFLAMLDLDSFKYLNDTFGHTKGDQCLEEIGHILKKYSTDDITTFRFGGDEFCILFKNKTYDEVIEICTAIREEWETAGLNKLSTFVTLSIGISQYVKGMSIHDLLQSADKALYDEKNQKNSILY